MCIVYNVLGILVAYTFPNVIHSFITEQVEIIVDGRLNSFVIS